MATNRKNRRGTVSKTRKSKTSTGRAKPKALSKIVLTPSEKKMLAKIRDDIVSRKVRIADLETEKQHTVHALMSKQEELKGAIKNVLLGHGLEKGTFNIDTMEVEQA